MENPAGPIEINKAIEGGMPFLSKIGRQKNLKIRTSYGHKLPAAAGNFSRLQCLILALFDNFSAALEPSATATITTDKTMSSVIVSLSADCTAISDSGKQPFAWRTLEYFATENRFEISRTERRCAHNTYQEKRINEPNFNHVLILQGGVHEEEKGH